MQRLERALAAGAALYLLQRAVTLGPKRMLGALINAVISTVPGASQVPPFPPCPPHTAHPPPQALDKQLESEVEAAVSEMFQGAPEPVDAAIPAKGVPIAEVVAELTALKAADYDPAAGLGFAYVYSPVEAAHKELSVEAVRMFCTLNALNPTAFPSLRKMEVEVVSMCRHMTGAVPGVAGCLTSGGTESILMAVKAARSHAVEVLGIEQPECVLPTTAHPAFAKAGHYLGVKMVWVPPGADHAADLAATEAAITPRTCLLVGSAPQYAHGVLDPIEGLGALAQRRNLLLHVDACFGGFVLPWLEAAGHPVAPWDFRVPGVTSISMDMHKYGFCAKGASCVLYRDRALRQKQYYAYSEWPGGLFVSPSALGTRSGGPIASAWATMRSHGQEGYVAAVRSMMDTAAHIADGVRGIDGLGVVGRPCMCALAIEATAPGLNIYAVADAMEAAGSWRLERNLSPPSLHLSVMPPHAATWRDFVADLRAAVATVQAHPAQWAKGGSVAMYGMVASVPDGAIVDRFLVQWLDQVYTAKQ